jgi:hypothetical protein
MLMRIRVYTYTLVEAVLNGSAPEECICHCHVLSRKGHCACALTSGLAPIKCIFQYSASVDISSIMHFRRVLLNNAMRRRAGRGSGRAHSYRICISHFRETGRDLRGCHKGTRQLSQIKTPARITHRSLLFHLWRFVDARAARSKFGTHAEPESGTATCRVFYHVAVNAAGPWDRAHVTFTPHDIYYLVQPRDGGHSCRQHRRF